MAHWHKNTQTLPHLSASCKQHPAVCCPHSCTLQQVTFCSGRGWKRESASFWNTYNVWSGSNTFFFNWGHSLFTFTEIWENPSCQALAYFVCGQTKLSDHSELCVILQQRFPCVHRVCYVVCGKLEIELWDVRRLKTLFYKTTLL